jgi:hypothetical protein
MPLSVEELLRPRYKVIADYFFNPYKLGDIITLPKNNRSVHLTTTSHTDEFGDRVSQAEHYAPKVIDQYPHLFQPLQWWEDRNSEDMPEYVIEEGGHVFKTKWKEGAITENGKRPMRMRFEDSFGDWQVIPNVMCFFQPATLADYQAYINNQKTTPGT